MNLTLVIFYYLLIRHAQDYVLDRCDVDFNTGCWNWRKSTDGRYGQAYIFGKKFKSHVVSVWAFGIKYKKHHITSHKCNNTKCCNPAHLEAVPQWENIKYCYSQGRR